MSGGGWESSATVCMAVLTGTLTLVVSAYGLWRTVRDRRVRRLERLLQAANVAVRQTDASVVRPLLRERLMEAVDHAAAHYGHLDPLHYRLHLLVTMQRTIGLTPDQKRTALDHAVERLVALVRLLPNPPLRLPDDAAVARHRGRLEELVEVAYNLRPRPAGDIVATVGQFCRGVFAAAPGGPGGPTPAPSPSAPDACWRFVV